MALADYEELATRSFDESHDAELRQAILVCADDLEQSGDPRGTLISLEHALRDAPTPRRAIELRKALHEHAAEHCNQLLGGAASLLAAKRTVTLEWRSGKLYGVHIDARYMTQRAQISAGELVKIVLKAPAASVLRRLRVRVRGDDQISSIVEMLAKRKYPLPLEQLEISARSWPTGIGEPAVWELQQRVTGLVGDGGKYQYLHHLVIGDQLVSLPLTKANERFKPENHIEGIRIADPPTELRIRVRLGRALTAQLAALRSAALARIAELGPAANVYQRSLEVLLQPRFIENQVEVVHALAALGPSHARARLLAQVASRATDYEPEVRKAAGAAAFRVRPPTET